MRYQPLKHNMIKLASRAEYDLAAGLGVVLIPQDDSKIYLHWLTDSGKLAATYTMTFATRVEGQVKLINALDKETTVRIVEL